MFANPHANNFEICDIQGIAKHYEACMLAHHANKIEIYDITMVIIIQE